MQENVSRYFEATQYATAVLGDDAHGFFSHIRKLSRYNSSSELRSIIDGWRPTPKPTSEPTSEPIPKLTRWTPCRHFGGNRLCERCVTENTRAGIIYAGVMAKANEMFRDAKDGGYREFVQYQIKVELFPWTNGTDHHEFDDIEQKVWQAVASRIAKYEDTGTPMAWLKTVVHSTIVDHYRKINAAKRGDDTKTGPLDFDMPADGQLPVKPTSVPVDPDTDQRKVTFDATGTPFVKS